MPPPHDTEHEVKSDQSDVTQFAKQGSAFSHGTLDTSSGHGWPPKSALEMTVRDRTRTPVPHVVEHGK